MTCLHFLKQRYYASTSDNLATAAGYLWCNFPRSSSKSKCRLCGQSPVRPCCVNLNECKNMIIFKALHFNNLLCRSLAVMNLAVITNPIYIFQLPLTRNLASILVNFQISGVIQEFLVPRQGENIGCQALFNNKSTFVLTSAIY